MRRGTVLARRGPTVCVRHGNRSPWDRPRAPGADPDRSPESDESQGPSTRAGGRQGHPRSRRAPRGTVHARRGPTYPARRSEPAAWDRPRAPGADSGRRSPPPRRPGPSTRAGGRRGRSADVGVAYGTVHARRGPTPGRSGGRAGARDRPRAPGADAAALLACWSNGGPSSRAGGRHSPPSHLQDQLGTVLARRGPTSPGSPPSPLAGDRPRAPGADTC